MELDISCYSISASEYIVVGFEFHYIRGKAKMRLRVSLALVVMLAMAVGRIRRNQEEAMRSLVKPAVT